MLLRRLKYPNTTGLILRRTYPELYKSHIFKLFDEYPIVRQWWNESRKEILIPGNNSRLFFGSAEHEKDMANFYSAEFADIMPDEAQEFSQDELEKLSASNRCTTNSDIVPKMVYTFMPGLSESGLPPKGLNYLKRVFPDNDTRGEENKRKWKFVQAFSWDNIEWAKKELARDGVSEDEFYSWNDAKRRDYFIERTEYGASLAALTNTYLRDAWLYGKWGVFQGQYFQNFQYDRDTVPPETIRMERWHRKWLSGDWGDYHPACFHWHAEDEQGIVTTYREFWCKGIGEEAMGQELGRLNAGDNLSAFFFSWDAFGKLNKYTKKSIVRMIGEAMPSSMPQPTPADASPGSRISGWRLMSQMIDAGMWKISRDCTKLIECLPTLVRDMQKNPEDVLKVDHSDSYIGDDPADSARYGLQNMLTPSQEPWEVTLTKALDAQPDYTKKHMLHLQMEEKHEQASGTIYHPAGRGIWRTRRVM
jgi:hypothetical protein